MPLHTLVFALQYCDSEGCFNVHTFATIGSFLRIIVILQYFIMSFQCSKESIKVVLCAKLFCSAFRKKKMSYYRRLSVRPSVFRRDRWNGN